MTDPQPRTVTVHLPSDSPNPISVVVPDGFIDRPSAVIVSKNRAFVRSAAAAYVEAPVYIDLAGDALAADKADLQLADADAKAELVKLRAELADAHRLLTGYSGAIDADFEQLDGEAKSWFARVEKWLGIGKKAAPGAATSGKPLVGERSVVTPLAEVPSPKLQFGAQTPSPTLGVAKGSSGGAT